MCIRDRSTGTANESGDGGSTLRKRKRKRGQHHLHTQMEQAPGPDFSLSKKPRLRVTLGLLPTRVSKHQTSPLCFIAHELLVAIFRCAGSVASLRCIAVVCHSWETACRKDVGLWRSLVPHIATLGFPNLRLALLKRTDLFAGCSCVVTGFGERSHEIQSLISSGGGTVQQHIHSSTTHMITNSLFTPRCRQAVTIPWVRVVSARFITESWELGSILKASDCKPKALLGCCLCVTGFSIQFRALLSKLVSNHGGIFTLDLTSQCTHLVAQSRTGPKVQWAVRRGLPVVHSMWVFDCVTQGVQKEQSYPVWEV
eukprot:TRINITY_DN18501_c0_g1_i1.p1 TRINITY_DN18501_c0_g1~~TRINITY_DN18501_c0_g1_i1.p1  ORF type:complete len:312 (+),score=23.39 TRINITY_DN18501_c0_g1_i1:194-1129(+)